MSIKEIQCLKKVELNNKITRIVERNKVSSIKNNNNTIIPRDKQTIKKRAIHKQK
jgi:hypothetical protein